MDILVVEPYREPYQRTIPDTLRAEQDIVGGYIETAYPFQDDGVILVCNEEGMINRLPFNRLILPGNESEKWNTRRLTGSDLGIFGTFFLCGDGGENFSSLSPELMEKYKKKFARAHDIVKISNQVYIVAGKAEPAEFVLNQRKQKDNKPNKKNQPER